MGFIKCQGHWILHTEMKFSCTQSFTFMLASGRDLINDQIKGGEGEPKTNVQ